MFENPRRGRQARNFTTNFSKILVLKSSSEQIFFQKLSLGAPDAWPGLTVKEGVIGNLLAAVQLAKQIAQLFWFLENELNCHDQWYKFINRILIGTYDL